jgi:hypothetical protein
MQSILHTHYLLIATALVFPALTFAQQHVNAAIGIFTSSTDIGTTRKGSTIYSPSSGEYRVTGGGADIWGMADDFHFNWIQVYGDLSLTADVRFPASSPERLRKAVLMVRQSLDSGSAYADVAIHGDGHINLQFMATGTLTFSFVPSPVVKQTTRFQPSMAQPVSELSVGAISSRPSPENLVGRSSLDRR